MGSFKLEKRGSLKAERQDQVLHVAPAREAVCRETVAWAQFTEGPGRAGCCAHPACRPSQARNRDDAESKGAGVLWGEVGVPSRDIGVTVGLEPALPGLCHKESPAQERSTSPCQRPSGLCPRSGIF